MSVNYGKVNEIQASIEPEFLKLNISNEDSKNCSRCNKPFVEKLWCKECDPCRRIEGWTSGNSKIDEFIKDTIYNVDYNIFLYRMFPPVSPSYLEWVSFDRFKDVKQIGKGGYAIVYSAMWIDGPAEYFRRGEIWKKSDPRPRKVALKRLNGSQSGVTDEYLNELKILWNLYEECEQTIRIYGITKDPETKEFMIIMYLADQGSLKDRLSSDFSNISWDNKIKCLINSAFDLRALHKLGYFHKDFHCGNILQSEGNIFYVSDFGLSGPANEQKSNGEIHGVLPYIAPEVLNGKPYTTSSDIYSFGIVMTGLSSGEPPFHKMDHNGELALKICNGLRPKFGKGTPEFYKKIAERCTDADPNKRPTAEELHSMFDFWRSGVVKDDYEFTREEVKVALEKADKEIPNIVISREQNPGAVYTSRLLKPVINSYHDEDNDKECQDSQLLDLEI